MLAGMTMVGSFNGEHCEQVGCERRWESGG